MKTAFSIVIPVYNAASTLSESLQSVKEQSFRNFEVILINDGSTDRSAEIANDWKAKTTQPVKLINQSNKGLGAARNRGIREAQSPWIALLDADDLWASNRLEILSQKISTSDADLLYHPVMSFGVNKARRRRSFPLQSAEELLTKGNPIVPSAAVIHKRVFEEFSFSEDPRHHGAEDLELWLRLLFSGKKFQYLPEALTQYRESGGMSTDIEKHLSHVFHVLEDLYAEELFSEELLLASKKRKHQEAARFYQKRGEFVEAQKHYALSELNGIREKLLYLAHLLRIRL